ncbi:FAD-binding oxidoreductase [Nemorincola caseinilytica]|uniref:FAD-binding oxidoreductase n=1 Tax=Nemorincola caseinilytica TaxID=2054315 RepID=A0ABP8NEY5_9BACT
MKPFTRRKFIHLSAAASAALLLDACLGRSGKGKDEQSIPPPVKDEPQSTAKEHPTPKLDLADKNDSRYNTLRQGFNKRIDKYPAAIALCTSTADVVEAVRYAREQKFAIAVKSGGHSMEGFSCNDGGLVVNLSKMNTVELLPDNKIKLGPGCTLSHLYDSILPHGLLLPGGSCGTVAVGGLTLGGGYGLFSRSYGLTCDHLLEATMVDGNGDIHSTKDDAELLWALKGGGTGNFGIVTEMTFCTQAAPATLQAHYFKARKLTAEKAAEILRIWMEVTPQLPASCFSGYVLNGSTLNILVTDHDAAKHDIASLLQKLADVTDTFRSTRPTALATMLRNYYGRPGPLYFRNSSAGFFKDHGTVAPFITDVFRVVVSTPGMIYQVNTLGGEVDNTMFAGQASYPHRGFPFISEVQAYWESPSQDPRLAKATTEILGITAQHGITRQYVNYCSAEFNDWEHAYYGDNYARLQAIKKRFDPSDNIRHPQSVKA